MNFVKQEGGIFISTPFQGQQRLKSFDVPAYKIGSGMQ